MEIKIPAFSTHFNVGDQTELIVHHDGKSEIKQYGFNSDGLAVWGKNVDFMKDPLFVNAYQAGINSGHKIGDGGDIHVEWRVLVCCWAAWHAKHLEGDFVECGVNTGIISIAICNYIDFNSTNKSFYLFDTFCGIPQEQMLPEEIAGGRIQESHRYYEECYELAKHNFAPFPKVHLVRGRVPDTLNNVPIEKVCYLSIDMNIVAPEIAAIEYFYDKLVSGAPVILDDYGFINYHKQKEAWDAFAAKKGIKILLVPTGQGLFIKT